ncbi:hypothetical protein [Shimia sagamensis]|uniref:Alpha/beta hydrolase family protein n=1 Tax=Shimia sagamensis TaxID=1566352 RepID=A0ABY1PF94_9RHOB|nr:hypothetical protein [Shimia sagamensis]SMP31711.1 hypothetical protein SAMN06265373_10850 [Shimia sagamensis]
MAEPHHRHVRKRRVFYVPGYDPIHPRRYRELYRKEGAAQAEISDYELALSPKTSKGGPYGWHVTGQIEGQETQCDVEVLVWSDIVRDSMEQGIVSTYGQLLRTAWTYIGSGALWRLMQLRKGPVIAALYPVLFLLVQLLLALLAAWGIGKAVSLVLPEWTAVFGLIVVLPILQWFQKHDGKFFAYYLMHDYAYSASTKGANPPALEARMAEFADRIAEALQSECDEVLVVGHSSGAHLAVSVLADLIRDGRVSGTGPTLGFLSLGQVVPMVSFLPKADRLRADLAFLCQREELTWVDVTAPGDGCAFALCDPVSVSGVAPEEGKRWPLVVSAAFTQTLSEARWAELRWRFFRLHFQYLCAFDRPGDYDYFRITAGPKTLAERYEGRKASGSRIEKPINKFTSVAS